MTEKCRKTPCLAKILFFFPVLIGCVLIGVMTALFADCATTVPSAVIKIGPALKHISSWVF